MLRFAFGVNRTLLCCKRAIHSFSLAALDMDHCVEPICRIHHTRQHIGVSCKYIPHTQFQFTKTVSNKTRPKNVSSSSCLLYVCVPLPLSLWCVRALRILYVIATGCLQCSYKGVTPGRLNQWHCQLSKAGQMQEGCGSSMLSTPGVVCGGRN